MKAIDDENLDSPVWSAALTVSSDREECLPPWLHICTEDNFIFEDNLPQYLWIPPSYKTLISLLADDDSLKLSGDIDDILDQQELDIEPYYQ